MPTVDTNLLAFLVWSVGAVIGVATIVAAVVSWRENEPVAFARFIVVSMFLPVPYLLAGYLARGGGSGAAVVLLVVTALTIVVLLFPFKGGAKIPDASPVGRIDERDIMFSRAALVPGTERFEEYYKLRPENKGPDEKFRANPGLLRKGASAYHPVLFSAADASFFTIEQLRPYTDGEPKDKRIEASASAMTTFTKQWAKKLGAASAGVTELEDYHWYSVVGRGPDWGQEVTLKHKYAVALTVEMDKRALDSAPLAPSIMESSQQYVAAGVIAVQLAELFRNLGYPARAHIDGDYRVVCPLVARDAGLGEIGRMGLLMTPELGPRVRIAVVTTDLPLVPDRRVFDPTVIDFCERCKKCANVCPAEAITWDSRTKISEVLRWQIDSEKCYTLWSQIGTDCARCVSACPYSHPDNLLHNLVRGGVRNSALFRKLAVSLDDAIYGRKPEPAPAPDWQDIPVDE